MDNKSYIAIGGEEYKVQDYSLPAERNFRAAWEKAEGSVITVNMDKAKEVWRQKIRHARVEELEKLDTEFMLALETGADTTAIVAKKQALRDAPNDPGIEAATTPEELMAVQPIPNVTVE